MSASPTNCGPSVVAYEAPEAPTLNGLAGPVPPCEVSPKTMFTTSALAVTVVTLAGVRLGPLSVAVVGPASMGVVPLTQVYTNAAPATPPAACPNVTEGSDSDAP